MRLPKRAGQCVVLLAVAIAGDAGALSRAMWAEFNAIYLMNLAPSAHCSTFRTRSLELLRNEALGPQELDAQMRALWKDARAACLQPLRSGRRSEAGPTAGPAVTPAATAAVEPVATAGPTAAAIHTSPTSGQRPASTDRPAPVEVPATAPTSARPTVASPPTAGSVAARDAMPQVQPPNATPGTEARAGGARAGPVPVAAPQHAQIAGPPQRWKPLIERPSVSELRLMADCERHSSDADPTRTGDGRCAALGRGREAVPAVSGAAAPREAMVSWQVWTAALLGVLAASGAAAWWALRRRRSSVAAAPAPASEPVDAHRAAGHPVAGDPAAGALAVGAPAAGTPAAGTPVGGQPVGKKQTPDDALEFALPS